VTPNNRYDYRVSRGLGVLQQEILGELLALPIEAWKRGIPLVKLAATVRAYRRQVRRAVYSLQERGLVTLQKESRVGRQGVPLIVWYAPDYESWRTGSSPSAARGPGRASASITSGSGVNGCSGLCT
jgi:hypothetical protein